MATLSVDLDGTTLLPAGKLAAIVTYLEMTAPAPARAINADPDLYVTHVTHPEPHRYRELWHAIGTPWLWFSRLDWGDEALRTATHDPQVEVHILSRAGRDIGLAELDFRRPAACELSYFGVVPEATGSLAARCLMNWALKQAWSRPIGRFWVHTCTLDHPRALDFYRRTGFVPYARGIERLRTIHAETVACRTILARRFQCSEKTKTPPDRQAGFRKWPGGS